MSRFVHYAHCSKLIAKPGQYVKRGDVIARLGSTGNSTGPHCHLEGTKSKPVTWWRYVRGMSLATIKGIYFDVTKFYADARSLPIARRLPAVGYKFMQFVKEAATKPYGGYWHPGDDVNGVGDFGTEIRALFNGRIVFWEETSWVRNAKGQLVRTDWNQGWGQHMWQEVDEANPGI